MRFQAYGWNVIHVDDANDCAALADGVRSVPRDRRPADLHRRPFGDRLGLPHAPAAKRRMASRSAPTISARPSRPMAGPRTSAVPRPRWRGRAFRGGDRRSRPAAARGVGGDVRRVSRGACPISRTELDLLLAGELPEGWDADIPVFEADAKGIASRDAGGKVLNAIAGRGAVADRRFGRSRRRRPRPTSRARRRSSRAIMAAPTSISACANMAWARWSTA